MAYSIDIVVGMVRKRINQRDKNFMACFVGDTGSGKSSGALAFAERVDPTFTDACRVVFTPADFLRTIIEMSKGQAVIFDEAGVGISSREWQKIQVKLVGFVAQLFRHKNLCVIFTVPSMGFVEKQTRSLSHAVIHFKLIDVVQKLAIAKWNVVKHNPITGWTEYDTLKVSGGNGDVIVDPVYFPQPSEKLWTKYLRMKESYANNFYAEALAEATGEEKLDSRSVRKMKNQIKAGFNCINYLLRTHNRKEVANIAGASVNTIHNWMKEYEDMED